MGASTTIMVINNETKNTAKKDQRDREIAQYVAGMVLELRNLANSGGLKTLMGLLEITYCEAFSVANRVIIPEGELEKLREIIRSARA